MTREPAVHLETLGTHWLAAADGSLSAAEEIRAARFRQSIHRDLWRASRAWVRHHLGEALGIAPGAIAFETDSRGRPNVVGVPPGFDCNWSHSGQCVALAIGWHGPVGIDIEMIRPDFPAHEIEAMVCTPGERAALATAGKNESRARLFFRLWTAKEALMKAIGLGVALDPSEIDVLLSDGRAGGYMTHPSWLVQNREVSSWVATWTWAG